MSYTEKYEIWKKKVKDRKLHKELMKMTEEEKNESFYKELEFGTAGIRGIMGVGTNRLNIYTVRKITQGVVLYMKVHGMKKAVISYDSRINSDVFAQEAASIFAASDMNIYITPELMPTPFLSFATRHLQADIGIMITASHNPREYNGYKVYDKTGCQLRDDETKEIAAIISKLDAFRLRAHSFDYYFKRGNISYTPYELEDEYLAQIEKICPKKVNITAVYTPLNGTGYRLIPKMLESIGCKTIFVPEQCEPSGKFITCPVPNPEKKEALKCGIKLLKSSCADVLIASDPDADRIGIAYLDGDKEVILSGNEIGILMSEYLLRNIENTSPIIVKTVVSTDLVEKIAENNGAKIINVPTGFKYIGNVINDLEEKGEANRFLLGFEESQGYLIGTHVRDKDAVVASKIMAIIADELKKEGKTFGDKLKEIYEKYGYCSNTQISFRFEGEEGDAKMKALLQGLRDRPLDTIAGKKVDKTIDYLVDDVGFTPANMIMYAFEGGKVIIRPSGTEPLIKLYLSAQSGPEESEKLFDSIKNQFAELFA